MSRLCDDVLESLLLCVDDFLHRDLSARFAEMNMDALLYDLCAKVFCTSQAAHIELSVDDVLECKLEDSVLVPAEELDDYVFVFWFDVAKDAGDIFHILLLFLSNAIVSSLSFSSSVYDCQSI
jgi:hypothetical protein